MRAQELELLRIVQDLSLDNDDEFLTPTFSEQLRACYNILKSRENAETALRGLMAGSRSSRSVLVRPVDRQASNQTTQRSNVDTGGERPRETRTNVKFLEEALDSVRHVVEKQIQTLLNNKATRSWVQDEKSPAAVLAAEQYEKYLDRYVSFRKAHDGFRLSSHSALEERAARAGLSYDEFFRTAMQDNINGLRNAERNYLGARTRAIQEGVELLALPYGLGDVLPEVTKTLPGDMQAGSWDIKAQTRATQGLERAGIEEWVRLPNQKLDVIYDEQHGMYGRYQGTEDTNTFVAHDTRAASPSDYTFWSQSSTPLDNDDADATGKSIASTSTLGICERRLLTWDSHSNVEWEEQLGNRIQLLGTNYTDVLCGDSIVIDAARLGKDTQRVTAAKLTSSSSQLV
ncbi:hypothetical protein CLAFUW4_03028 [Fulvia fulva]|uniref:Uncharacterized protein n=1 Tax=Passalora fulva TaxID=5499 RepID=A0A9Q8LAD3_PASFU|nr:uncharacterized protein CLAFUR5_03012 [Fulvia fulva]KAK4631681.1 hypothetical protein CLAFUR4_03021 [Fulvia fulva]KAK4633542.1 hypothetical protein CLAFUR0_03024 [Fulvia fulva]UJO13629.1 hypothetical protein CLAFUR5_03012 [Fulvia fulva]WPV10752.1 hypothetical protein CLAFUW4_03028 [Fulvia fulva]WPV25580.1 hypothetical protein CLAFUW7_03025 [Fulvia fulva]